MVRVDKLNQIRRLKMSSAAQANPNKPLKRQQTLYNLDTMEEVTLVKTGEFVPVTTVEQAMARLNGNTEKFLEVLNVGLEDIAGVDLKNDPAKPWQELQDDGTVVPFTGTVGDQSIVTALIYTLAKSFGYTKEMPKAEKDKLKEDAKVTIRDTPGIKQRIIDQAKKSMGQVG